MFGDDGPPDVASIRLLLPEVDGARLALALRVQEFGMLQRLPGPVVVVVDAIVVGQRRFSRLGHFPGFGLLGFLVTSVRIGMCWTRGCSCCC